MKFNYRALAKQALKRAQDLHETGGDDQLRYAALELRLAMEALTYDRAQGYMKELPIEALSTWQPQKLMDALLEIDPTAATTATLLVGEEPDAGFQPESMMNLGTDTVFGLRDLREHYHAMGSFLHMPTMRQVESGDGWDTSKVRRRLTELVDALTASLNSKVWNITLGVFSEFPCFRCDKSNRKRMPVGEDRVMAKCIHCNAPHIGSVHEDRTVSWEPETYDVNCPNKDCDGNIRLFVDEIKPGARGSCPQCHKRFRIAYGIVLDATADEAVSQVGKSLRS